MISTVPVPAEATVLIWRPKATIYHRERPRYNNARALRRIKAIVGFSMSIDPGFGLALTRLTHVILYRTNRILA